MPVHGLPFYRQHCMGVPMMQLHVCVCVLLAHGQLPCQRLAVPPASGGAVNHSQHSGNW